MGQPSLVGGQVQGQMLGPLGPTNLRISQGVLVSLLPFAVEVMPVVGRPLS